MPPAFALKKIGKVVAWVILLIFLLLALALAVFRFAPQAYVSLVNKFTPYNITSETLNSELLPATLAFTGLRITQTSNGELPIEIVSADSFFAQIDYMGFLSDHHNFWYAELHGGEISVESLTSNTSESNAETATPPSPPVNIHRLLSVLNMKISDTSIAFNEDTQLTISELNTNIGSDRKEHAAEVEQNIELSLTYGEQLKTLSILGTLASRYRNGQSEVTLDLRDLDLTPFIQGQNESEKITTSMADAAEPKSESIDWDWLQLIEPTLLAVNIDKVTSGKGWADSVALISKIDDSIEVESLQGTVKWPLSKELWLIDRIELSGKFTPDNSGLLDTRLSLTASDSQWDLAGSINLTAPLNSQAEIELSATTLPLLNQSQEPSALITENLQWFPVSSKLSVVPSQEGTTNGDLSLAVQSLTAGESDLSGSLKFLGLVNSNNNDAPLHIQANLRSKQLRYQSPDSQPDKSEASTEPTSKTRLFSQDTIDWAWMSSALIDASIDITTLSVDQRTLNNITLPILLNKDGLVVEGAEAELGDGAIRASIKISPPKSDSVNIELNTKASGIVLNDLKLVDEATLKGGDSKLDLSLVSSGNSPHAFASNLSGNALFHLKKATIGNDAFELIGSDLIAELISKLNPFLKSDPTTDLKCAIVNLDINQGQIKVDNSIAMETSKMIVVADGKINLSKETIKLEIKPQSTDGLGLDAGSLVKFLELGGTLANPKPTVGADGLLKSGVAVGAAISTGGASLVLDGLVSKMVSGKACERALKAGP